MRIDYRTATDGDYELCRILHHQGLRPYVEPLWGWNDEFQNERFKRLWDPANIRIILLNGEFIGYIEVLKFDSLIKLNNIFVSEERRGKGIGTQVVSDFISQNRGSTSKMTLNVLWNNPAAKLYERLGFKFVSQTDQIKTYELIL